MGKYFPLLAVLAVGYWYWQGPYQEGRPSLLEQQLQESLTGTGHLLRFWPEGHWQHYQAHFEWEADRLESIAQSLAGATS